MIECCLVFEATFHWPRVQAFTPNEAAVKQSHPLSKAIIWPVRFITWKWCETGHKLLLQVFTNNKLHMGFQSVSKSVIWFTLNGPMALLHIIWHNMTGFGINCVKFTEARPILSQQKCSPWSLVIGNMWFMGDDECYVCDSWASSLLISCTT